MATERNGEASWGDLAGSAVMQIAADRGLDTNLHEIYPSVCHHAALADILTATLRKPDDLAWQIPEPIQKWTSSVFISPDGSHLRRVILVSHWTDEREQSEKRSWGTMGEICQYKLPMKLAVMVIGHQRNGKRSSPWVRGFAHPANRGLRFRKKERTRSEVFSDRWEQILREDHTEITRETWLNAMLKDDVLREAAFHIDIPVPPEATVERIRSMAERKLEKLYALKDIPEANLSTCEWPVPCIFKRCCWGKEQRAPSSGNGFLKKLLSF